MAKRTSTKTSKRSSKTKFRTTPRLSLKEIDATSIVTPQASEITSKISDTDIRAAAEVINGSKI
ncbi:MAG: hypothetical protein ACKO5F_15995 [Synechococcus sp.]